jgi:hypothetical protein
MRSKLVLVYLGILVVVTVLGPASAGQPAGKAAEQLTPGGKAAVADILERVRRTGCFNHPDCPWVVRARRVRGNTLFFVDFLRRGKKGFDLVGKAVQITLRYSSKLEPIAPPGGLGRARKRRDTLQAHVRQIEILMQDGTEVWCDEHVFDLSLPARLRANSFRPWAEIEGRLSRGQREALAREFPFSPEQKKLRAAFGDECDDLLQLPLALSETGQTVVAYALVPSPRRDRFKLARIAIARFDKAGKVLVRFRGKDITASVTELSQLLGGDDSQELVLTGRAGLKLVIPGTRPAP